MYLEVDLQERGRDILALYPLLTYSNFQIMAEIESKIKTKAATTV